MNARKPLLATDRASILLLLVPYLIGKDEVSLAEAAAEFDVTPDQMRGMVEKLTLIGKPGDGGYWQMPQDMFDIDWDLLDHHDIIRITNVVALERAPKLSAREAAALIAGLQVAQAMPGVGDSTVFAGLLAKLSRGASAVPAEVIVAPGPVDEVRGAVGEAVRSGVAVEFSYKSPDAPVTRRTVDPVTVLVANGQWYLQGWCHLREAMRTFNLERVSDLTLTDIPIGHGTEDVPELFAPSDDDLTARIRFTPAYAPLLGDYLNDRLGDDPVDTSAAESMRTASVRVVDPHSLKRLAARGGGAIEILEPAGARRAAADWAAAGLAQYR